MKRNGIPSATSLSNTTEDNGFGDDRDVHYYLVQPSLVDWDGDGDMDLILGPPDGRYFDQLQDGTLHEWPLDQSPVRSLLAEPSDFDERTVWRFLDCDGDGDLDMIRLGYWRDGHWQQLLQACEQIGTHQLQYSDDFLCLGSNLSGFNQLGFGDVMSFDLGDLTAGRLQLIAAHEFKKGAVLWTAGFCSPQDACHEMGLCLARQANCSCIAGHELVADCSGCGKSERTDHPRAYRPFLCPWCVFYLINLQSTSEREKERTCGLN